MSCRIQSGIQHIGSLVLDSGLKHIPKGSLRDRNDKLFFISARPIRWRVNLRNAIPTRLSERSENKYVAGMRIPPLHAFCVPLF
jgi:hypothetical protein